MHRHLTLYFSQNKCRISGFFSISQITKFAKLWKICNNFNSRQSFLRYKFLIENDTVFIFCVIQYLRVNGVAKKTPKIR